MGCSTISKVDENSLSLKAELSAIINKQKDTKPGLSVLVKHKNKTLIKTSKGLANQRSVITENTAFRIGSISKTFTALSIMTLVESGQLSLSDNVKQHLASLPNNWADINIKDLLSHKVSLSKDFFAFNNLHLANNATNSTLLSYLQQDDLQVSKLERDKAVYCNTCYVLLAEIVKHVSDQDFNEYMAQHVFMPANMKQSYIVDENTHLKPASALNYAKTTRFFNIEQYTTGAMAQVSSINDLDNFITALKQEKIVSKSSLDNMTQVHSDLGDDGLYGLGWIIGWGNEPFFAHSGSQDGYQSELFLYPKYDLEVAILSNGGDETFQLQSELMQAIISHFKALNEV